MRQFSFLDSLEDTIVEQFSVLDKRYARDMFKEMQETLSVTIENENEVRYLLIDGETGQLESRQIFESFKDAEEAIKKMPPPCLIGTLIVEQ